MARAWVAIFLRWSGSDTFAGGGVRFGGRPSPRLELFVDALVGGWRRVGKSHWDPPSTLGFADFSETTTAVSTSAGGGLALWLTRRVGVRSGLEMQNFFEHRTKITGDTTIGRPGPLFRFTTELVVGIGSR